MIKTFKHLIFEQDTYRDKHMAATQVGVYTISVGYGDGMYGDGPEHDAYEVAVWETHSDRTVPLSSQNDVLGWTTAEEIDALMHVLATEPGFGDACRVFKRTHYNMKFSMIGQFKPAALV